MEPAEVRLLIADCARLIFLELISNCCPNWTEINTCFKSQARPTGWLCGSPLSVEMNLELVITFYTFSYFRHNRII